MAKKKRTVYVKVHGMEGEGANKTEAKADAIAKLEAATAGSYTAEVIVRRNIAALLYRRLHGWDSHLIADDERGMIAGPVYTYNGLPYEEARRSAIHHVCQLAWRREDGYEPPEIITDAKGRDDFERWAKWQLRYAYARQNMGLPDDGAHYWATGRTDVLITPEMLKSEAAA